MTTKTYMVTQTATLSPQHDAVSQAHLKMMQSYASGDMYEVGRIVDDLNNRFLDREFWYELTGLEIRLHSRPKSGSFFGGGFIL